MRWWAIYFIVGVTTAIASILFGTTHPAPVSEIAAHIRSFHWRRGRQRSIEQCMTQAHVGRAVAWMVLFMSDTILCPFTFVGMLVILHKRRKK